MERTYIKRLKQEIESKLSWETSSNWKQRDYEYLSELIFEKTKILLSVSTLKRIWSPEIKTIPHHATLNALAQFLDYKDWNSYKIHLDMNKEKLDEEEEPDKKIVIFSDGFRGMNKRHFLLVAVVVLVIILLSFTQLFKSTYDYGETTFSSKKVITAGIPNTVVFDYDVSTIKSDSIFIQQSWDKRMRARVFPKNHKFSSIYYYPGYHKAKLIVDNDVLKQHDIHITTNGWLGLVRYKLNQLIPVYLTSESIHENGRLHVSEETLEAAGIDTDEKEYLVSYYNVRDFGKVSGDNFILETEVKSVLEEGSEPCQKMMLYIMCKDGRQAVSLAMPGCSANLTLRTMDEWIIARENDLSMFGCDMNKWNKLKIVNKEKKLTYYLNDKEIYSVKYETPAGEIIGLHYLFTGTGSIKSVVLSDGDGKVVYKDIF